MRALSGVWLGLGLWSSVVAAQEPPAVQFFACGTVRFFAAACATPAPPSPAPATTASAPGVSPPAPAPATEPPALFTPETVAPSTPPVVLRLLQEPTEAHARAVLAWHRARLARLQEVQALVQRLSLSERAEHPSLTPPGSPGPR